MSQLTVARHLGTPLIRVIETEREALAKCRTWLAARGLSFTDLCPAWPCPQVEQPDPTPPDDSDEDPSVSL